METRLISESLAQLPPWEIYATDPRGWPRSPGRIFVPAAVSALLETLFHGNASDIAAQLPRRGDAASAMTRSATPDPD